jgi:predicted transglutaminase-like cysteine proteinase
MMRKGHEGQGSQRSFFQEIKLLFDRRRLGEMLVMKGVITPQQLRLALQQQKETGAPLGQVFITNSMISKTQLHFILGRQSCLRIAAGVLFFTCLVSGNQKRAHAEAIKDVPAQITLASISGPYNKVAAYPALFGMDEKQSQNLAPFVKWTGMFKRFESELRNADNKAAMRDWQENLKPMASLDLKTMAAKVNDLVNEKPYILDNKNWGSSDYWATPVEFLQRGGDCEDFAIAKYTALRSLGVPEDRLRVAIVHDTEKNIPHAILIVYTDQGPYFLDNQLKRLMAAGDEGRYRPIFSINREAWWLHTAPSSAVIASAQ